MLFNTTLRVSNLMYFHCTSIFNISFSFWKQNYGYSVGQLWDLLQEIRVHYNEVLMQHWVQVFRDILDEDSFLPIQVYSFTLQNYYTFYILIYYRLQRRKNMIMFLICFRTMTKNYKK